jgi:hypothetical protein
MIGQDFRNVHGTRLQHIDVFTEQFETYAMQRSLGENTFYYAWPSTFLLGFIAEPIVTILVPYQLGKVIIRTHREIRGACAEAYLMAFEFDLGRYADILLNVFLGILIFYFPGGYIWTLFFFMALSHCYIYAYDHWRVIQVIPYVKIVSNQVDWWAQVMMCACCGLILSCTVFKANCESYVPYCMQELELVSTCAFAGIAHFLVHFGILYCVIPKLVGEQPEKNPENVSEVHFKEAAAQEPRTWFSANPVECLRSKYIRKESPHCHSVAWGKEHLLEINEKINCFYQGEAAREEDFSTGIRMSFVKMMPHHDKEEDAIKKP